jgi:hypothetical protein
MSTQEKAEQQKKKELYDPDTCAEINESGCTYPDCDNCEANCSELEDDNW